MKKDWTPKNPLFKEEIIEKLKRQFFMKHIGLYLDRIEPGFVDAHLKIEEHHLQQNLFVHGGVISTLCDVTAGFAAFTLVNEGEGTVTADLKVSYYHPGKGDILYTRGWVEKAGSRLFFCESEVWSKAADKEDLLIAKSSSTMAVIKL